MAATVIVAASLGVSTTLAARAHRLPGQHRDTSIWGSHPPRGLYMPALDRIPGIEPPMATSHGRAHLVVATCLECRSGSVIGALLGYIDFDRLPQSIDIDVIAWGATASQWASTNELSSRIRIHAATDSAAGNVRGVLHLGGAGAAFLYDSRGVWRATYQAGQMRAQDIEHDARVVR